MKEELSGLDLHFLLKELDLENARFQRAYEKNKEVFLQLHKASLGKALLRIKLPGLMYLASDRPDFPKTPSGFIMFLRKKLKGYRIAQANQVGMDRIVELVLEKKEEQTLRLIIELISPGNVLLLGRKPVKGGGLGEEVILHLQSPHTFKDRTLRGGIPYEPPAPAANIKTDAEEELVKRVQDSGMDSLVKALAVGLNLGGEYAELVCKRTNLDKNKTELDEKDIKKAISETKKLLDETPSVAIENQTINFFADKATHTINEALDERFTNYEHTEQQTKKPKKTILEIQEQQQKGFEKASKENQEKGEAIYEHYNEIKEIMAQIKAGETPTNKAFKKFDKKTGTITLEY